MHNIKLHLKKINIDVSEDNDTRQLLWTREYKVAFCPQTLFNVYWEFVMDDIPSLCEFHLTHDMPTDVRYADDTTAH